MTEERETGLDDDVPTWGDLFDRAAEFEVSETDVPEALTEVREDG